MYFFGIVIMALELFKPPGMSGNGTDASFDRAASMADPNRQSAGVDGREPRGLSRNCSLALVDVMGGAAGSNATAGTLLEAEIRRALSARSVKICDGVATSRHRRPPRR